MSLRTRLMELENMLHRTRSAVIEGKISTRKVMEGLENLFKEDEKPWWEKEKRYNNSWVLQPITPELLWQEEDQNFEYARWTKLSISNIEPERPELLGADIYKMLTDTDVLEHSPSLEAFDFYEKNSEQRVQYWDRTNHWVYAFRDAVISKRAGHNILVPGMLVFNRTGEVHRKWKPLQAIFETRFKVLIRN